MGGIDRINTVICDKQGKKNLVEIKDEEFRKKLENFYNAEKTIGIGDYLCKKHIVQLRRYSSSY